MSAPFLSIKNLELSTETNRGTAWILRGVNLSLERGRILGVVGESGSGKSSLANVLMGLVDDGIDMVGEISLSGTRIDTLSRAEMEKLRGERLAMIFQDPMTALNPVFRVGTQLVDVVLRRYPGTTKNSAREQARDALAKVGLADPKQRLRDYPHQLSGGMRQRVMIAMALLCQPEVLIADEPTTALDATIEAQIVELLIRLRDEFTGSVIFISHHLGTVAQLCDEVAVMYGGTVVETGDVLQTLTNPIHPYTRALVGCEVDDQPPDVPLKFIPGQVPETTMIPTGCIFAERCTFAQEACLREVPKLRDIHPDHFAACLRAEDLS